MTAPVTDWKRYTERLDAWTKESTLAGKFHVGRRIWALGRIDSERHVTLREGSVWDVAEGAGPGCIRVHWGSGADKVGYCCTVPLDTRGGSYTTLFTEEAEAYRAYAKALLEYFPKATRANEPYELLDRYVAATAHLGDDGCQDLTPAFDIGACVWVVAPPSGNRGVIRPWPAIVRKRGWTADRWGGVQISHTLESPCKSSGWDVTNIAGMRGDGQEFQLYRTLVGALEAYLKILQAPIQRPEAEHGVIAAELAWAASALSSEREQTPKAESVPETPPDAPAPSPIREPKPAPFKAGDEVWYVRVRPSYTASESDSAHRPRRLTLEFIDTKPRRSDVWGRLVRLKSPDGTMTVTKIVGTEIVRNPNFDYAIFRTEAEALSAVMRFAEPAYEKSAAICKRYRLKLTEAEARNITLHRIRRDVADRLAKFSNDTR